MEETLPEVPPVEAPVAYDPVEGTEQVIIPQENPYWKFLDELEAQFGSFMSDARAGALNKSAALRARKLSVVLRKSLKEYREVSVAHDKTHGRKNKKEAQLSKEIDTL